jgi:hypothetical protein
MLLQSHSQLRRWELFFFTDRNLEGNFFNTKNEKET